MTFTGWMKVGVPVVVTMIPLMWLWLSRGLSNEERVRVPRSGPWRAAE
jgi:di/tricarboxylate transporter